jgi:hypothetical protein
LRLHHIQVFGPIFTKGGERFLRSVRYGDVSRGLPLAEDYCDRVYASHVLEHVVLDDFYQALLERSPS